MSNEDKSWSTNTYVKLTELDKSERINYIYSLINRYNNILNFYMINKDIRTIETMIHTYNNELLLIVDDEIKKEIQKYQIHMPLPVDVIEYVMDHYMKNSDSIRNIIKNIYAEFLKNICPIIGCDMSMYFPKKK